MKKKLVKIFWVKILFRMKIFLGGNFGGENFLGGNLGGKKILGVNFLG